MKKIRKFTSLFVLLCLIFAISIAPSVGAYEMTDLERTLQNEDAYVVGTYVYGDEAITIVAGGSTVSEDSLDNSPTSSAAFATPKMVSTYNLHLFSSDGTFLLTRTLTVNLNGSAGSYSLSPTSEWNWYTTDLASGVLLGGVSNTRVSSTVAKHSFTWYYNGEKFRTTETLSLNTSTGRLILSSLEQSKA